MFMKTKLHFTKLFGKAGRLIRQPKLPVHRALGMLIRK